MELELKHLKLNPVTVTVTPVFPVVRIWDMSHTLRASVVQKSVACIRQNDLSGCAHRYTKRPLHASVSEITLGYIRFQDTKTQFG